MKEFVWECNERIVSAARNTEKEAANAFLLFLCVFRILLRSLGRVKAIPATFSFTAFLLLHSHTNSYI